MSSPLCLTTDSSEQLTAQIDLVPETLLMLVYRFFNAYPKLLLCSHPF
jgi:hypothetical protein